MTASSRTLQSRFDRMSRKPLFLLVVIVVSVVGFASYRYLKHTHENRQELLVNMLLNGVQTQHYNPMPIDDAYSEKVFNLFLKRLDYGKKFFLQSDIKDLETYKHQIDDESQANRYDFFDAANAIYEKRLKQVTAFYPSLLDKSFDFNKSETYETDPEKSSYAKDSADLREQWRKYLKYETLLRLDAMQEDAAKLKARKDTAYHEKTIAQMETEARDRIRKSNEEGFKRVAEVDKDDRFNLYLNTLVNVEDPHTEYFPPADKANFDIAMTGQLQGIGAQLQEKDGMIKVTSIIAGGPAYRDGRLKAGDVIMKVKQETGDPVEVTDMRLDKAVQLIRGKKGTKVTLYIKKPDGGSTDIQITRDVVVIEETYAQSAVIKNGNDKIGYIRLPGFYADFGTAGGRDCATDVKHELEKLKKENVDGVVLDLRDNGGGSLESVVTMMGLFIKTGPVVQVKTRSGSPQIMSDDNLDVTYSGPLVVMVNEGSASASEILAGAVQDYKRGIIIGSSTTFGKGTVQRVYNLDDMVNASFSAVKPLGSLKITLQKFYRISGASTQLKGVTPDVVVPDLYSMIKYGEKEEDFPMPWDEIAATKYESYKSKNFDAAVADSRKRVEQDKTFNLVKNEAAELKRQSEATNITLTLDGYKEYKAKTKDAEETIKAVRKDIVPMTVALAPDDAQKIGAADTTRQRRNKDWMDELAKDVYLKEASTACAELK